MIQIQACTLPVASLALDHPIGESEVVPAVVPVPVNVQDSLALNTEDTIFPGILDGFWLHELPVVNIPR